MVSLFLFASATLYQYSFEQSLGIDELFFSDWMPPEQGRYPGRPSPATSLCFLALAVALIVRDSLIPQCFSVTDDNPAISAAEKFGQRIYAALIMATGSIVFLSLLVWLTGSSQTIFGNFSSGQSLLTCSVFLVASLGLLFNLITNKPLENLRLWLPQSTFVAVIAAGIVLANNTHENRQLYYQKLVSHSVNQAELIDESSISPQDSPDSAIQAFLGQDYRGFIISLSVCFALVTAIATKLLIKARLQFLQISEANSRLSTLEYRNRKVLEMAPEAVILADSSGTVIYANQRSFEIFGHKPDDLQGQPLEILLPGNLRELHRHHRKNYHRNPVTREMGQNLALEALHADGHPFPVDIVLSPIEYEDNRMVMAIIRDISDKIADKKRIEQDLHEKEVLLKEVYHRVKNNIQVIASLLKMQSRATDHPQTKVSLDEAALRISALALVHEQLYQSPSLARASLKSYIENLSESLRQNFLGTSPLKIQCRVCDGEFEPEVIVPIGLILNELITNALKHAFVSNGHTEKCVVQVFFDQIEGSESFELSVQDNGEGITDPDSLIKSKSLGIKLVRSLAAQLKGDFRIESEPTGSRFIIEIPAKSLQPASSPLVSSGIVNTYRP